MSNVAQIAWLPYFQDSFGRRPTASTVSLHPAKPAEASRSAREPHLLGLHLQLDQIASLPANWDGNSSAQPLPGAVEHARQLLDDTFRATSKAGAWQSPLVSASEDGEIVLEWWNGIRKLTVYVGPKASTYVKSWGRHVIDEMEDGELPSTWLDSHWTWLFG